MFSTEFTNASMLVLFAIDSSASPLLFVYVQLSPPCRLANPCNHEMIATTDKAVWHLKDGKPSLLHHPVVRDLLHSRRQNDTALSAESLILNCTP